MDRQELMLCGLQISDWIAVVEIIVTSAIGIWVAITVQNNLTKSRYLKEYFINEVKDIRDLYKSFINRLYKSEISAIDIKDWFKVMSERTQNLDKFLGEEYCKFDSFLIVSKHAEIQQTITSMDEFNENYKEPTISFANSSKKEILKLHSELSCVLTQRIIDINSAKKRKRKKKSI
ncbi:hypothetical protein [Porphyromonas gingivalis]|uniref:Uncharacterized protein n=1 Tax=Porphyromonas gingivalis TaxID=837 RepID=A0AAF0BCW5_PORGN|nr:hypothetical protein [Porphyromonas gingivalis]WCF99841.1 hypothetical protein NY149_04240 [Porphyromonas gingivalis]